MLIYKIHPHKIYQFKIHRHFIKLKKHPGGKKQLICLFTKKVSMMKMLVLLNRPEGDIDF